MHAFLVSRLYARLFAEIPGGERGTRYNKLIIILLLFCFFVWSRKVAGIRGQTSEDSASIFRISNDRSQSRVPRSLLSGLSHNTDIPYSILKHRKKRRELL